ncbi:MAG: hypothetical protein K0R92_573 [Lachnospiraceae bacterium]|nr:hypothetical protein [Anaerocolumna sp.]MDF2609099.1 hypothetical protein [Lachnospiraceae bacterium]
MINKYIKIESTSEDVEDKIKQKLRYPTDKFVWRVKFSAPLNPSTVNNRNLHVTSLKKVPLKTRIHYDSINGYIEIEPLEPYSPNESYILTVTTNVKSASGVPLKREVEIQFKI